MAVAPPLLGVEGIEHHAVTCCVSWQNVYIVQHKFIRPIVSVTQTAGHSYQRRHLIGTPLGIPPPGTSMASFSGGSDPIDLAGGGAVIFKFLTRTAG